MWPVPDQFSVVCVPDPLHSDPGHIQLLQTLQLSVSLMRTLYIFQHLRKV